jgi:hypothetical protein
MPIRTSHADWRASLREDHRLLRKRRRQIRILRRGGRLPDDPYLTLAGAKSSERMLVQAIANKRRLLATPERDRSRDERRAGARDDRKPKTPGYNKHLEIAFTTDRRGRPIAYYYGGGAASFGRWIRMPLDDARHFVATGEASQVTYTGNLRERINPPPRNPTSNDLRRARRRRSRR